jgi:hypothetical protein
MEDVIDVYQRPYDPQCPVVCMDESNKQLSREVREPIPAGPGQVRCEDSEWERNGVADVFMFVEPLAGRRFVSVTEKREAVDWARQVKGMLTVHYPEAPKARLVMDNLNTHDGVRCTRRFRRRKRGLWRNDWRFIIHPNMAVGSMWPNVN